MKKKYIKFISTFYCIVLIGIVLLSCEKYQELKDNGSNFKPEILNVFLTPFTMSAAYFAGLLFFVVIISLLIPALFRQLKRLKLFQLEIEFEDKREKEIVERVNESYLVLDLLNELESIETKEKVLAAIKDKHSIEGVVELLLKELDNHYQENYKLSLKMGCFTEEELEGYASFVNSDILEMYSQSKERVVGEKEVATGEVIIRNSVIPFQNYLVYAFKFDGSMYAVVIKSHSHEFPKFEGNLVRAICDNSQRCLEFYRAMLLVDEAGKKAK